MSEANTKAPGWYMPVVIVLLLWNLMGIASFYMHVFISEEALAALPANEAALFDQYPMWTKLAFAISVFGGGLGTIGLIMKKKWSKPLLLISLVAILIQMGHSLFMTDSMEVYGMVQSLTMPILVIIIAIYEVTLANKGIAKGWIK